MDTTEKVIYIMITLVVIFGGFIFVAQKTGMITTPKPATYYYSNGNSKFEVTRVNIENYVEYQIKFFYGENPQPHYANIRNDPVSLEDISIDRSIFHKIKDDKVVFITIDPFANLTGKTTVAAIEIDKFIDNKYFFNIPVNSSMTKPYSDYPVKTCNDATKDSSIIWLRKGEENKITSEGDCIIVEGKTEDDLIRVADRLALYLVGIMP